MQGQHKFVMFLGIVVLACLIGYGSVWGKIGPGQKDVKKPHIVFIIADDMGWNDVSFHGADQIPTPNIDALAYNGVILNRHYVLPICTPSRTSLMTGRYATREGMQGFPLKAGERRAIPLSTKLMPDYMHDLGYTTRLVGKWHLGYYSKSHTPARRGFDSFFGYYNGYISYYNSTIRQDIPSGRVLKGYDLHRDGAEGFKVDYSDPIYFTDLITNEAEEIIRNNGNEKPLFLEIAHLAVHTGDEEDPLQVRDMTETNANFPHIKDLERRKYAGMMKAMDESVGRVVKALSEAKMLENSIIVFIADNGAPTVGMYNNTGSNFPFRGIKTMLYEGGVRGAGLIFSPLIRSPSRVSEQLMHITDWMPTLYAAAGGDTNDLHDIDGVNQWRTISRNVKSSRDSILLNIDEVVGMEAAIIGKYKYIKDTKNEYSYCYGISGNDPSNPKYRVEDILSSPVGSAIFKLEEFVRPSVKKILRLRERSIVRCDPMKKPINCTDGCLFDIFNDPCESKDLKELQPKVVKNLKSFISRYSKILMRQTLLGVDPCSHPEFFNGTYMPWIRDDVIISDITRDTSPCEHPTY